MTLTQKWKITRKGSAEINKVKAVKDIKQEKNKQNICILSFPACCCQGIEMLWFGDKYCRKSAIYNILSIKLGRIMERRPILLK